MLVRAVSNISRKQIIGLKPCRGLRPVGLGKLNKLDCYFTKTFHSYLGNVFRFEHEKDLFVGRRKFKPPKCCRIPEFTSLQKAAAQR